MNRLLVLAITVASLAFAEDIRPAVHVQPQRLAPSLPAMGTVASLPSLYSANDDNWISVVLKSEEGWRVVNARAKSMPLLMHVRPGDTVNLVTQKDRDQEWVLSLSLVGQDGRQVSPESSGAEVISVVDRSDAHVLVLGTKSGHSYKIDRKLATFDWYDGAYVSRQNWSDGIRVGEIVRFEYVERADGRWATQASISTRKLYNPHCDPQVVTKVVSLRRYDDERRTSAYWYYIWTQFPNIKYDVDSRWNQDVRLQRVGDPPIWHKDRDPSPFSTSVTLSQPSRVPPVGVSINVEGDNINNSTASSVASNNSVTGTNTSTNVNNNANTNSNTNNNTNSNTNQNSNTNNNTNNNQNQNNNTNQNNNQNNNTNQNQNQNQNQNSNNANSTNQNTNNVNQNTAVGR